MNKITCICLGVKSMEKAIKFYHRTEPWIFCKELILHGKSENYRAKVYTLL